MPMDATSQCLSSIDCEVSIIRAKNIEFNKPSSGGLFVRCYISAGNNQRIQLNTKEIPSSRSDFLWNEHFSLECLGTQGSINSLRQGNVVFELRRRCTESFLGRISGSKVIGRAEIPWKNVFESPSMEIEAWVQMVSKNSRLHQDVKPAKVQVRMKVGAPKTINKRSQNDRLSRNWEDMQVDTLYEN